MSNQLKPGDEYAFATGNPEQGGEAGMTLRDYVAASILPTIAALAANGGATTTHDEVDAAFRYAEAFLICRSR